MDGTVRGEGELDNAKSEEFLAVAGLGNIGTEYQSTRHNLGFAVVDELVSRSRGNWKTGSRVIASEILCAGRGVKAVKAVGYMNQSGGPLGEYLRFFKIAPEQLIVVHDELDVALGSVRIKRGGGDGGHNGVASVVQMVGREFVRVRVGIGRCQREPAGKESTSADPREGVVSWVLGKFTQAERDLLEQGIQRACEAVAVLIEEGLVSAQNKFNR